LVEGPFSTRDPQRGGKSMVAGKMGSAQRRKRWRALSLKPVTNVEDGRRRCAPIPGKRKRDTDQTKHGDELAVIGRRSR